MLEIRIDRASEGQKAEKFVKKYLKEAPLGFIYKAFRKKDIKVNGHWVPKDHVLHEGDALRIYVTDQQLEDFKKPRQAEKKPFPYEIIYEDRDVLIVNKPKGLLVYGDDKGSRETLGNAVLDYLYYTGEYDPNNNSFTPSPAHRLDRNTSGLVVYGKTDAALKALTELFKERTQIEKHYQALVVGDIDKPGEVNIPLKKDAQAGRVYLSTLEQGGKTAITRYKPLKRYGNYTLVEVDLITGRTHQIRAHMAAIHPPVVGDNKYGDFEDDRKVKRLTGLDSQALHASDLYFKDVKGVLSPLCQRHFHCEIPAEMERVIDIIKK